MAYLRIRSYNAYRAERLGVKRSASDKLIMQRSYLHSHTELQFSERYGFVSFSSTLQDDAKGCRFKHILYSHPEYWDTITFHVENEEEDLACNHAKSIEGRPYDLLGLLSFGTELEIIKPSVKGYWCTEAVVECVKAIPRFFNLPLVPDQSHPTLCDVMARYYFESIIRIERNYSND